VEAKDEVVVSRDEGEASRVEGGVSLVCDLVIILGEESRPARLSVLGSRRQGRCRVCTDTVNEMNRFCSIAEFRTMLGQDLQSAEKTKVGRQG
jgi:hypothetical protein